MEIYSGVAEIAIKRAVFEIKRQLRYVFQWESQLEILEKKVEQLKLEIDWVEQASAEAAGNSGRISDGVKQWLNDARKRIIEADQILQRKEEAEEKNHRGCVGVFPRLEYRYRLARSAYVTASDISSLVMGVSSLIRSQFWQPLEQIVLEPLRLQILDQTMDALKDPQLNVIGVYGVEGVGKTTPAKKVHAKAKQEKMFETECDWDIVLEPSLALPSRLQILDQIMDALKDPQLNVIGVYGMGGVGKTTLAKKVHGKAKQEKMFETVVLVAVSQTPEVRRIQTEIAELLGMELDVEELSARASQLYQRLQKSNVLIILDDLWDKLDLVSIGIPSNDSLKSSKLLLISREVGVLRYKMRTQKEFSLGVLEQEEAWKLFCALVPKSVDPPFQGIATKISEKCACLLPLIDIATKALHNKELDEWIHILQKISAFEGSEAWEGMSKQQPASTSDEHSRQRVNNFLATIPGNEHGEKIKSLFFLCSMFKTHNIDIQRLLINSMGLGLFEDTDTVRDTLFTWIDKLKSEHLLLDGDVDGFVKMDDAVRGAAISIASKEHHVFVGEGRVQLRHQLDRECTKIILPYCNISQLPGSLECPKADLFSLCTEDLGLKMPHSFFKGTKNLKVVEFTGMRFMSLPSSLTSLTNLETLSLQKCQLHNVSSIGKLKQLKQLSFACSRIVILPEEIQELTQLKLLDLSNCTLLQVIPANVLSELRQLEQLYMLASFKRWDAEGNASLEELKKLNQLSALEIQIQNPKLIPGCLEFLNGLPLKHTRISVPDEWVGAVNGALLKLSSV